eukprot:jgi/Bigna1/89611/estExt_fgenesh1_pg.C_520093
MPLQTFLETVTIGQAVPSEPQTIRTVREDETVGKALELLSKYRLLSMPVTSKNGSDEEEYKGVVNISDIIFKTVFHPAFARPSAELKTMSEAQFKKKIEDAILKMPVSKLIGERPESRNLFVFHPSDTIATVSEYFSNGTHRVLVKGPGRGSNSRILSQSDVMSFLCKHLEHELVQPTVRLTLEELGMVVGQKNMVCLRPKDIALTGFRKLLSQQWTRSKITRSSNGGIMGFKCSFLS